jgi:hypothetical protein
LLTDGALLAWVALLTLRALDTLRALLACNALLSLPSLLARDALWSLRSLLTAHALNKRSVALFTVYECYQLAATGHGRGDLLAWELYGFGVAEVTNKSQAPVNDLKATFRNGVFTHRLRSLFSRSYFAQCLAYFPRLFFVRYKAAFLIEINLDFLG